MSAVRRASYAVAVLLLAVFATAALAKGGRPTRRPVPTAACARR